MTASAKPGNIGTSFEITFILSLPYEIVKRFAKIELASVSAVCVVRVSRRKNKRKKSDNN